MRWTLCVVCTLWFRPFFLVFQATSSKSVWHAQPTTPEEEPAKKQFKKGERYYCKKVGHFAFECPEKPKSKGKGKGKGKGQEK